jgi:hypothetical protein
MRNVLLRLVGRGTKPYPQDGGVREAMGVGEWEHRRLAHCRTITDPGCISVAGRHGVAMSRFRLREEIEDS